MIEAPIPAGPVAVRRAISCSPPKLTVPANATTAPVLTSQGVGLAGCIEAPAKKTYLSALKKGASGANEVLNEALKEFEFVFNHHNGEAEFQTPVDSSKGKPYSNKL